MFNNNSSAKQASSSIQTQFNLPMQNQLINTLNQEESEQAYSPQPQIGSMSQQQQQQQQPPQQQVLNSTEDEELKKQIALYYHTLFQGCLGQWFVLMQQKNYSKLTKNQYIELNIRIQKCLIIDFDYQRAQESALEDWKTDIERENYEKKNNPKQQTQLSQIQEESPDGSQIKDTEDEPYLIEYERLSEFFFDLCLSWCQYLEIEIFLFFLNGIFLNITQGSHVNVSAFKEVQDIELLSIEFFNELLQYRKNYDLISDKGETYRDWYTRNFSKQGEIVRQIEKNLYEAFKDKNENRILDLWIDMPTQSDNGYINQHFDKLDKDLKTMSKATKTAEMLTNSINMMEQFKKLGQSTKRIDGSMGAHQKSFTENYVQNEQRTQTDQSASFVAPQTSFRRKGPLKIYNTKEQRQNSIQKHLVGQLGDRFKNAKLLEVSENSYLITTDVRLPIFGKQFQLIERTKTSISKSGYLLKQNPGYTNQASRKVLEQQRNLGGVHFMVGEDGQLNINAPEIKIENNGTTIANTIVAPNNKNVVYEKVRYTQNTSHSPHVMNQQFGGGAGGKETLDSESDLQNILNQQPSQFQQEDQQIQQRFHQNQFTDESNRVNGGINVKVPDLLPQTHASSLIINNGFQSVRQPDDSILLNNSNILQQQQLLLNQANYYSKSPNQVDEKALKLVYDRYLQLLQEDKNATIENVLREEQIARQLSGQLDEREIEAAVMERLQQEEESADIQEMIAKFYNKFDELHEQSLGQALAKSPNKQQVKNEVKYKIPERWTKKFHKHDIIPIDLYKKGGVQDERGKVNKQNVIEFRNNKINATFIGDYSNGQNQQVPLNNTVLKESLSSRTTPKNEYAKALKAKRMSNQQMEQIPFGAQQLQQQQQYPNQTFKHTLIEGESLSPQGQNRMKENQDIDQQSTDVSKAGGDFTRRPSEASGICKPQKYDWSEVAHLFEDGMVPEELREISDPIEYNYILVRLKKDFNEKNRSEYMKYMNLQLPYHSRRDEIGGVISQDDWTNFIDRLEGIIDKVKKKRRRIIKRRKKKGIKKMPRKTLFKPIKKPNLSQDPLWREVFLEHSSSDQDDSDSDEEDNKNDFTDIYQIGLQSNFGSQKSTTNAGVNYQKSNNIGIEKILAKNAPLSQKNKKRANKTNLEMTNLEQELSLPPIMRPLLYEDFKNNGRQKSSTGKLRTAEQNLKETLDKYPQNKNMLNMRFKDYYYDPFDKEPHKASRMIGAESSTVKKVEHTYTKKIRKQLNMSIEKRREGHNI